MLFGFRGSQFSVEVELEHVECRPGDVYAAYMNVIQQHVHLDLTVFVVPTNMHEHSAFVCITNWDTVIDGCNVSKLIEGIQKPEESKPHLILLSAAVRQYLHLLAGLPDQFSLLLLTTINLPIPG
jgi:hypothetical protein